MPDPPRLDRRQQRTRAALLAASERLFLAQGFTATTVEQLAAEAGVALGSLYANFGSKEGLYVGLIERALDLDAQFCDAGWAEGNDGPSRLVGLAQGYERFAREHPGHFRLFRLPLADAPTNGSAAEHVAGLIQERVELEVRRMADALRESVSAGVARPMDPERTARALWAAWDGILSLGLEAGTTPDVEQVIREGERILTLGLLLPGLAGDGAADS